jgi:hypothetical protein
MTWDRIRAAASRLLGKPRGLLPCSQELANVPYPVSQEISPFFSFYGMHPVVYLA